MTATNPLDAELSDSKLNLISSLFNCRKDVFAAHLQKGKKERLYAVLGNLIALPFHKPALLKGNSCFVNPETESLEAYPDQWTFLSAVERVPVKQLNALYEA